MLGDTLDEFNETYSVDLTNPAAATIADSQGVGTITDDDPQVAISIGDASAGEGNSGTVNQDFTLSLDNPSGKTVTVNWTTNDVTATAGSDYVAASGTVTFNPGETSKTVTVQVTGDTINEINESFTVDLSGNTNATIADGQGVGTIVDDDPQPGISITDATVQEGNSGTANASFTVSLDNMSGRTITVDWTTNDGTATVGSDYVSGSGTLTFSPGQTTKTISVAVKGDTLDEYDETFSVDLSNPVHATIQDGQGIGTVTDDDATPALSINGVLQAEGDSGTTPAAFTVSLDNPSGKTVTVDWTSTNGTATAGSDFSAASGTVVFAPGQTSKTVSVSVSGDVTYENDETFTVDLSNPVNATIAGAQGIGTILNDDAPPSLSIGDVAQSEGDSGTTTMTFTVGKTGATALPATVDWATSDATAAAGSDYTAASASLTLAPGQVTATISVSVTGDVTFEPNETFDVNLSNPGGATISGGPGVGTIQNDDPLPSISVSDASQFEGDGGTKDATFNVTLSNPSYQSITADWTTNDGTASAGADYIADTGSVTFGPGETTKPVVVKVRGDALNEFDETFTVDLSNPVQATVADAQGAGRIIDDDGPVAVSVGDASAAEGNSGTMTLDLSLSLDAPSGKTLSVDWFTNDGTATAGSDYSAASGTVTFPPDVLNETISVPIQGDVAYERNETFTVDLLNPTNMTIADAQAVGTITNDDATPSLTMDDISMNEGNAGSTVATFTVSLAGSTALPAQVDWSTGGGTATSGTDYVSANGTVSFAPGEASKTFTVQIKGDKTFEADETFDVDLTNPTDASIDGAQGVGTLRNDDKRPTKLTLGVAKARKSLSAQGTLSGGAQPGMKVTVTLLELKGKKYVKAGLRTVPLTKVTGGLGHYRAKFKRPAKGRYEFIVSFRGDAGHLKSRGLKKFQL